MTTQYFLAEATEWTPEQLVLVIREQLADPHNSSMAESLRVAVMYCPEQMPLSQFVDAARACGIHPGTARNRYNEIRAWQKELGER